jgi:hypothetical protein
MRPAETMSCGGVPLRDLPRNEMSPCQGMTPDRLLSVEDFPAPFAPIMVTISPSLTEKEMSWMAWMFP